jgi:hypothetical protein
VPKFSAEDEEEEEEEGEVTPPHPSPSHEVVSSFDDIFHMQVGITINAHRSKWARTDIGLSTGSPS